MIDEQNFEKRCGQARSIFIEENEARVRREAEASTTMPEVFKPLSPEKLRDAANTIRKRQGLPPLP